MIPAGMARNKPWRALGSISSTWPWCKLLEGTGGDKEWGCPAPHLTPPDGLVDASASSVMVLFDTSSRISNIQFPQLFLPGGNSRTGCLEPALAVTPVGHCSQQPAAAVGVLVAC